MRESLLPGNSHAFLFDDIGIRDTIFADLVEQIEWTQSKSVVYGKTYDQPRLTAYYAESTYDYYDYSGVVYHPEHFDRSAALKECKTAVEELIGTEQFNAVVCNLYRNGQDSIAWHSDNERELGFRPVIASLSLGAPRTFSFRRKKPDANGKRERVDVELEPGSLLVMFGDTQEVWEHALLKTKKVAEPRINLTFRTMR